MAECSIPECDRPVKKRGMCRAHYLRWWRHGDPLAGRGAVKAGVDLGQCSVDGCALPLDSRGFCTGHYQRVLKNGDPGEAPIEEKRPGATCDIEGCARGHYARGLCTMHYARKRSNGDPNVVRLGHYKGDDAKYGAIHARLLRMRGRAADHPCSSCGSQAADWAYDMADPDERTEWERGRLLVYSTDPDRYTPMCRRCHGLHDNAARRSRAS